MDQSTAKSANEVNQSRSLKLLTVLLLATVFLLQPADLRVLSIISDHMVLQCNKTGPLWGWADASEEFILVFAGQSQSTTTNADGIWMVKLDALEASADSRELVVRSQAALAMSPLAPVRPLRFLV